MEQFRKLWGDRKNEDDWRRSNKSVIASNNDNETDYEKEDSIEAARNLQKGSKKLDKSAKAKKTPHNTPDKERGNVRSLIE